MRRQPLLLRVDQIGRQQQQAVGARLLGGARDARRRSPCRSRSPARTGTRPAVSATAAATTSRDLGGRQREELAGAAGSEQARHLIAAQPVEMLAVADLVEGVVGVEMRDGERQQAVADPAAISLGVILLMLLILQRLMLND